MLLFPQKREMGCFSKKNQETFISLLRPARIDRRSPGCQADQHIFLGVQE
jgi:hypothetical protein